MQKRRRLLRPRGPRGGFSLVELMIGMTIFVTSFLMILGVFPTSARSIHQARTLLLATHVAQQLMEQYVSTRPYESVSNHTSGVSETVTTISPTGVATTSTVVYPPVSIISMVNGAQEVITFNWQLQVSEDWVDHARDVRLKNVRLQVFWCDTEQATSTAMVRYVNLETRVTNP